MKNSFLFIILLFVGVNVVLGQVVIKYSNAPSVGDMNAFSSDTLPANFNVGNTGANQTWNFSSLVEDSRDTTKYVSPASTPYSGSFPSANVAITQDDESYFYANISSASYQVQGLVGQAFGTTLTFDFVQDFDQYKYDVEYGDNFTGNYAFDVTVPAGSIPPGLIPPLGTGVTLISIRYRYSTSFTDDIDAWGVVTTPLGSYDALRHTRVDDSRTRVHANVEIFGFPSTQLVSDETDVITTYEWLSPLTKAPLITMTRDTLGNINKASYNRTPPSPAPTANFTWSNTSGGLVAFTNTSTNNPVFYSWNFGDGFASAIENPNHTYSFNGTYYTCLTATNATGANIYCDSVTVTLVTGANNAPVANTDFKTVTQPDSVDIDLLFNDADPDNDNISLVSNGSASNGTVTGVSGGVVNYKPNVGFIGVDSFTYTITDDGAPQLQSTGLAIITVNPGPASTVADFTSTDSCFEATFTNTSTNALGIPSWDFGDNETGAGDVVNHTYAQNGTYNVCITVLDAQSNTVDYCNNVTIDCDTTDAIFNNYYSAQVKVYPNPASNNLFITIDDYQKVAYIELLDLSGKQVKAIKIESSEIQIDVSQYAQGMYLLKLVGRNNEILAIDKVEITR